MLDLMSGRKRSETGNITLNGKVVEQGRMREIW
jgi:hypothetical protein